MPIKCTECGRIINSTDGKPMKCISCHLNECIKTGKVNYNVQYDYKRSGDKIKKRFYLPAWPIAIANFVLVLVFFIFLCVYNQSIVSFEELFEPDIYEDMIDGFREIFIVLSDSEKVFDSEHEFVVLSVLLIVLFLLIPISLFNIADLISSLYWMPKRDKRSKKRRCEIRGTAIKWIFFWPLLLYIGMWKYMFSFIKVFLGIDENSKYVPINTNTSSGIYSPSSFGSSGNNSRSQSFVDGAGVWRDPGSGFVDNSGVWRDPGSGFVDGSGVWRESGSGFVDSSGVWRDPGSGFVDGAGVWRDGK